MKRCSKCEEYKPEDQFHQYKTGYRAGKLMAACILCKNEDCRDRHRRKKLGLTVKKASRFISENEVRCCRCKEIKNTSEFYFYKKGPFKGKPLAMCKPCNSKNYAEWKMGLDPDFKRVHNRIYALKRFGLTWKDFEDLVKKQEGKCLICGLAPKEILCIDHDHKTGKVRGLLCHLCNTGLGKAEKFWPQYQKYLIQAGTIQKDDNPFDVTPEDMIDWEHELYGI